MSDLNGSAFRFPTGSGIVATPLLALTRTSFADLAAAVQDLSADRQVCAFIVGLPLNMNGTEGPRCQASRAFARNLAGKLGLPTTYWDERLSTAEAERHLIAGDLSRRRRRQLVDKVAAALILQSALDRLQQLRPRP